MAKKIWTEEMREMMDTEILSGTDTWVIAEMLDVSELTVKRRKNALIWQGYDLWDRDWYEYVREFDD